MAAKKTLAVSGSLQLETRLGTIGNPRWIELLAALGDSHSITQAAKAVGLSYKAAWDAVEAMNNLSDRPLVERVVGGKGGGGTRLTLRGSQLVETYRAVAAEHARFLERVNGRINNAEADLRMLGRLTMMTSARNHFSGKVVRIKAGAVNDEVELELSGGERLVAIVTHESVENLGLKKGVDALALVKASWVIVALDEGPEMKLSARNRLRGSVSKLTRGAVNSEVVIGLKGGNSVAAVITNTSVDELGLTEGKAASAIFKASSVILGVAG
ncbi:MAG TPA: TOBE domain-containing protein [Solimonas sp.]|nr:TOBE domain-containing protein [Solimonas sp.]